MHTATKSLSASLTATPGDPLAYGHYILKKDGQSFLIERLTSLPSSDLIIDRSKVRRFMKDKSEPETFAPFKNIEYCPPNISLLPASHEVEEPLRRSLRTDRAKGRAAFLLSGGIDTTALVTLAYQDDPDLVCYTAKTDVGRDLMFTRAIASHLKVPLVEVPITRDQKTLDRHRAVVAKTLKLLPLNGNFAGVSAIAEQASKDGFDVLIDGTGGGEIYGGSMSHQAPIWISEMARRGRSDRLNELKAWVGEKRWASLEKASRKKEFASADWKNSQLHMLTDWMPRWTMQTEAISETFGVKILSPMLSNDVLSYALNDADLFYVGGVPKAPLRNIIRSALPKEIADRRDNQGLRFPMGAFVAAVRKQMLPVIQRNFSDVPTAHPIFSSLRFLGSTSDVVRAYAVSVFTEELKNYGRVTQAAS